MTRKYPRFLYSDPKNTKSEGPFCVHLLPPRMICKVGYSMKFGVPKLELFMLNVFEKEWTPQDIQDVLADMQEYIKSLPLSWKKDLPLIK